MTPNMIGAYGEWAAQMMQDPARLSFRQPMFGNVEAWRAVARARYREMLMGPGGAATPVAARAAQAGIRRTGDRTPAVATAIRTPDRGASTEAGPGQREAAGHCRLHDHGGNKYFGLRKITRMSKDPH